ncbi:MAG: T9SS type A sorting domain-containing protein [Bacteroidia bacterium]|nr:T9SS type A sorting domain-containing protein [Bacteroidia bacterium]
MIFKVSYRTIAGFLSTCILTAFLSGDALATIPRPNKTVICVLENHGYPQVMGSSAAPYINSLANIGASLAEFYALTHPSQPNYIMFFSGESQGVTNDGMPSGTPWNTPNLGASLIQAGFTFAGYSEDLPSIGSNVGSSGAYARKHNPWVNWQGNGTNQIPSSCNLPFTNFPTDFNTLPDLSFVIPNQNNDMHNGSDPARITTADQWVDYNLSPYINWARNNNSLFILTFDEDNDHYSNRIPCIFVGPMVQQGYYYINGYHLYDLLRTLEDMYTLPHIGNSITSEAIQEIWNGATSVNSVSSIDLQAVIYPNPVIDAASILIHAPENSSPLLLSVMDITGKKVQADKWLPSAVTTKIPFRREDLSKGIYFLQVSNKEAILTTKRFVIE